MAMQVMIGGIIIPQPQRLRRRAANEPVAAVVADSMVPSMKSRSSLPSYRAVICFHSFSGSVVVPVTVLVVPLNSNFKLERPCRGHPEPIPVRGVRLLDEIPTACRRPLDPSGNGQFIAGEV